MSRTEMTDAFESLPRRFWRKVDKSGPSHPTDPALGRCWLWCGFKNGDGYGVIMFRRSGENISAHRASFLLEHGRMPRPCALHSCDNPACVNPSHLFEGTQADNVRDMVQKRRHVPVRGERNPKAKLTSDQVLEIRALRARGVRQCEVAARFRITDTAVRSIERGINWRHVR